MQAKKKSKKKPAAKSAPEKAKKTKQVKEEQNEKQPLLKTLIFGEEKPDLTELEAGSTTILDILSPTTVDTKSRDYIVVDGVFRIPTSMSRVTDTPPRLAPAGLRPWWRPEKASI